MSLEVGSLVSNPSVAGRVRFIEGIGCKSLPVGPYFLQLLGVMAFGRSLLHKFGLHFVQYILLLFSHRLSKHIGLTFGKSGNFLGKQHDLLLVNGDSVGFLQVLLHIL